MDNFSKGSVHATSNPTDFNECRETMASFGDITPEEAEQLCDLCTGSGFAWRLTCPSTLPIWPTVTGLAVVGVAFLGAAASAMYNRPWRYQISSFFRGPGGNIGLVAAVVVIGMWNVVLQTRKGRLLILQAIVEMGYSAAAVNTLRVSSSIAVTAVVTLWWAQNALQALILGTPSTRRLVKRLLDPPIIRDWSLAASEDVFQEVMSVSRWKQTQLFIFLCLLGVPWIVLHTPRGLRPVEQDDFDGTLVLYKQPTLPEALTTRWKEFPMIHANLTTEQMLAERQKIIPAGPWAAACLALLGYMMIASIFMPMQLHANAATNAAVWVAGTTRLKRAMALHGSVFSVVVFGVAASLTEAGSPLGPVLAFAHLMLVMVAAALAFARTLRRSSARNPPHHDSLFGMVRNVEWMVFLPLILVVGNVAINYLTPLPSNSSLVMTFCMEVCLVLVNMGVSGMLDITVHARHLFSQCSGCCGKIRSGVKDPEEGSSREEERKKGQPGHTIRKRRQLYRGWLTVEEGSVQRARQTFLVLALWCLAVAPGSESTILIMWIAVALLIALAVLVCETACTFQDLRHGGPRFGLLISAHDLAVALEARISLCVATGADEEKRVCRNALPPLRMFKGSPFRMCETLAMSYRWQGSAVTIANDPDNPDEAPFQINMSRWQMEQVLKGIRQTGARFVWLDKLSVPQDRSVAWMLDLQKTLLARMMAVYTSAHETLVLRSAEKDTGRYHQRAWTFQEFCSSRKLRVVSQDLGLRSPAPVLQQMSCNVASGSIYRVAFQEDSAKIASTEHEEMQARELRRMIQSSMHASFPVWIRTISKQTCRPGAALDGSTWEMTDTELISDVPDLELRVQHFDNLYHELYCQEEADRVRALVPVLFNSPTELQSELQCVVQSLANAFPLPQIKRALEVIAADASP